MVKVEANVHSGPKMKEACGGDRNWTHKHLLDHINNETIFKRKIVPRALKKMGSLDQWMPLTVEIVQEIVDKVFAEKKGEPDYVVTRGRLLFAQYTLFGRFPSSQSCCPPHSPTRPATGSFFVQI